MANNPGLTFGGIPLTPFVDPTAGMPKDVNGLVKNPASDPVALKPVHVSAADHVKNMQQFLKNRGYTITVDGVRGPQTNAVVAAFHNHVSPQQFNTRNASKARSSATPTGTPSGHVGNVQPRVPAPRRGAVHTGKVGPPAQVGLGPKPATAGSDPYSIDPQKYAASAANAQYDPTISALQAQLDHLDPQHAQNVADINSWINQIIGTNKQNITDTGAFDQKNIQGFDDNAAAIASLFGGATAPEVAGYHDIGATELRGLSQNQNAFQANMNSILAAQGQDNVRAENESYNRSHADLLNQLTAQRSAKGQAYVTDLQTGISNARDADTARQALALAQGMQPYQIATAKAQAAAAKAQAASAKADAANSSATAKANLDLINAKVQQAQAAAKAAGGAWNLKNPNDRGSLAQAIRASIGNKQGWLRVSPKIALSNISAALDQAGLGSDPDAKSIAQAVFEEVLNNSHSAKLFRNVTYVNGKLTVKAKPKPKK